MFTLTGLTSTVVESVGRLRYGSCHPAVAGVGAVAGAVHLALYPCECQRFNEPPATGRVKSSTRVTPPFTWSPTSSATVWRMTTVTRRSLLIGGVAGVALATAGAGFPRLDDPFTLGVASGDPRPDSVVLWTRLAPRPLAENGLGGMPDRVVPVHWELAEDERFQRVVRRGVQPARPELGHSVHVEPFGLRPGREYFYRFRAAGQIAADLPTG